MTSLLTTLSKYQLGILRWVASNHVALADLEGVHGGTLWSLLHASQRHGPLIMRGAPNGRKTRIVLTSEGDLILKAYLQGEPRERLHPGELTERCASLLKVLRIIRTNPREDVTQARGVKRKAS